MEYIAVGKLTQAHGTGGVLKAISYAGIPERYLEIRTLYVESDQGLTGYVVDGVEAVGPGVLIKLRGVDDRGHAQRLAGSEVFLPESEKIELPEDAWFVHDLIGLEVFDTDGTFVGILEDVLQNNSNDIYLVRDGDREVLIPAVSQFVNAIDLDAGRMTVTLIEGMVD